MKKSGIYCAGEFISTAHPLEVFSPYNNELIGLTCLAGQNELEMAINKALAAEKELSTLPSYKKYEALNAVSAQLSSRTEELARLLSLECGKPMRYARGEIARAAQTFKVAAEEAKRIPREYMSIDWTPSGEGKEGLLRYFPIGLVAGISPFNFPMNLVAHKVAPALAAGCPIILKPASATPMSALALAEVIHETGLPKGCLSVLPMKHDVADALVTNDRFKLLTFTGSPDVGWEMKNRAGRKRVVLELGGNAGVIVSKSADVKLAVQKCLVGGFAYSGQVCIHTQRIYVHSEVFDAFTKIFIEGVKALHPGNPLEDGSDVSVMIDEVNAMRVEAWVNEAIENGAMLLAGGKRSGSYFEPTVLSNTNREMKVCSHEIFGPVVTLEKYDDFEDAIEEINSSDYGLQAGVFTDSVDEMNKAFEGLEAGGIIINDVPTFRVDHMPYGGVKNSGTGREGVKYAIYDMLEPRLLVKNA